MNDSTPASDLTVRRCVPCEGGVPPCSPDQIRQYLERLPGWRLTEDGRRIRKEWKLRNFMEGMSFFQRVAELAEAEAHHPDLHLTEYRRAAIEIWTHAIGGLSDNDFILAAKIETLPVG